MAGGIHIAHYAVAFIDLLGQRREMKSHKYLPSNEDELKDLMRRTIGKTRQLHKTFDNFYTAMREAPSIVDSFTQEMKEQHSWARRSELKYQRFSDGLVAYCSLAEGKEHSPISSLVGLLAAAGGTCLLQLAIESPVRIGIDVGWGVEMNDGEFYGAALANAYELESQVAEWPRVAVGDNLMEYLNYIGQQSDDTPEVKFKRGMTEMCRGFLIYDTDGRAVVDFAGPSFSENVPNDFPDVFRRVTTFVDSQIEAWGNAGNVTLTGRYMCLKRYLLSRKSDSNEVSNPTPERENQ